MNDLILPWPAKELSPNSRVHWSRRAKASKAARQLAWAETINVGWTAPDADRIHLWIDFYPPTRRWPDDDNMLSRMKAATDGIADALGVDDRIFVRHPYVRREVRKGGEVRVRMTGGPDAFRDEQG